MTSYLQANINLNMYRDSKTLYHPSDPVIIEGYKNTQISDKVISPSRQTVSPNNKGQMNLSEGNRSSVLTLEEGCRTRVLTPAYKKQIPSPITRIKPDCDPIFDFPFSGNEVRPYGAIPGILRSWSDLPKLDIIEYEWRNQFYRLYKTGNLKLVGNRLFQRIVLSRLYPSGTDQWDYQYDFYTEVHNKKWNNFNGTYYLDTCDGLYEAGR
jgi:hypothetical protein